MLFSYAEHNEEVGYCQSMNLVLAHILLQLGVREERAFWLLATLIEDIAPKYHTPSMEGLQTDLQVLNELLTEEMPTLKTALNRLAGVHTCWPPRAKSDGRSANGVCLCAVPLDLIAMELLVGLFCTTLPR